MELKHYFCGALAALALVGMSSCSNDEPISNQTVGSAQTRYIQVAISGADGMSTRADNDMFAEATAEENNVKDILFLFYDADGKRTGSPVLVSNPQFVDAVDPEAMNVGKVLTSVVGVEMGADDAAPAYVMAFLNPARNSSGVTNYQDMNLTELATAFTTNVINEQNCFLMSNSVFYKADGTLQMATPIVESQLFETIEAAQKATGEAITNIYVERYAAKVVLNLAAASISNATVVDANGVERTLTFTPTQWFVNNSDYFVFRTKTYGKELSVTISGEAETIDLTPATYAEANASLGNWTWNDPTRNRSYWACSPSYYAEAFPLTADNVVNKQDVDGNIQNYLLDYFTWNGKTNTAWNSKYGHVPNPIAWDATNGFNGKAAYPFETTAAESAVNYDKETASNVSNPRAAIASVAITGTYAVSEGASADGTFYLYGMGSGNKRVMYNKENIKNPFLAIQNVIYKKVGTEYTILSADDATKPIFTVKHPDWAVLKINKDIVSEGMVTLQLTGENLTDDLYYKNTAGNVVAITADNVDHVNSKLITNLGTAEAFVKGKAWFNIPIRHLGFNSNTTDGTCVLEGGNNSYDWSKVHTGYFGLVRNHVYTLNVNSISGIGYGVVDEDNPLVPPVELNNYYIAYSLKILNWRVVPTQTVDL